MTQPDGLNRYGEPAALRPLGVETVMFEQYRPDWNPGLEATRAVQYIVESERHVWRVKASRGANPNCPAALRPWTCVDNCTDKPEEKKYGGTFERVSKRIASTTVNPKHRTTLPGLETTDHSYV